MKMIYKSLGLTCIALAMSAVSAFAQPEDGKVYRINNIHDGYTFGENTSGALVNQNKAAEETATQLWLAVAEKDVTGTATGRFAFINASSGKCLNSGTKWTTAKKAEYFYVLEKGTQAANAAQGAGLKYYNITTSSTAAGSTCLHCWSNTAPIFYLGDGGGSRWTFTEATGTTLSTIDASLASLLTEYEGYKNTYDAFIPNNPISTSSIALQATNANAGNYIMSNAPHNNGDNANDKAGCPALLDGNTGTYFHSRYSGTAVNEPHYLQVHLSEAVSLFRFHYTRRMDTNNNRPTRIVVSGSNDGVNFKQLIVLTNADATNPLPTAENENNYQSNVISTLGTPYTYIRFTVTATNTPNSRFGSYPFFTMSEFGMESVTATTESCVNACLNYKENTQPYINGIQGTKAMSAIYLPLYYSMASLANLGNPGDGVLEDKLTLIDYYVYYTDANGIKHYITINNNHEGVLTTEPVAFRFVNGPTSGGLATKAYQMRMNDYHLGHWDSSKDCIGTDPDTDGNTNTSPWHAQVLYYDATFGRFAIRGTNATGSGYDADKFYIVTDEGQLSATSTLGSGLYQWHIQPAYPFSVDGQKYFIKTRVQQSGFTNHLFNYQTTNGKVNLVEDKTATSSTYWTFNEVEEQGRYYLNIVPVADPTKVISYEPNHGNDAGKLEGKAVGTSGWDARFLLEYTGNTQAPYLLRPSDQTTYVSNIYGQGYNMGFYNSNTDPGSRLNFIPVIEQGNFYRMKGNASSKYLDASITGNRLGMSSAEDKDAAGSVFWFDNDRIISYSRGTYFHETWNINGLGSANGDIIKVYPSEGDVAGCYTVYHSYPTDQVRWLYDDGNASPSVVNRNGSFHANCNWIFEPVNALPVNISSVGWSTFYAPVAVTIPDGVTAYAASISGNTCTLTEVTGEVPAGTGLILYKQGGGTVEMPIIAGTEATVESSLTGSVETKDREVGTTYYALQRNSQNANKVGLYLYSAGQLKGFHAFYETTTSGNNVAGFDFDALITGIEAIQNNDAKADGHIYDLSGRRLSKPVKGWNIIGGQKVFIK